MAEISGFPYFEVQFKKDGAVHDENEVQQALDFVGQGAGTVTDLLVISHGWNNDIDDARNLYQNFFQNLRAELDSGKVSLGDRKLGVLAVLWPSKKFTDRELIPSGAASAASEVSTEVLEEEIDHTFAGTGAEADAAQAKLLALDLEDDPAARNEFVDLVRKLLSGKDEDEDVPGTLFSQPGDQILQQLSAPLPLVQATSPSDLGGATSTEPAADSAGGAAGLGLLKGIKGGAFKLLNLATYYQMKERAGVVGRDGLNKVLRRIREKRSDLDIHLIGHSFGGRLVSAAALGPDVADPVQPVSLTLLQAAFSHYGFSGNYEGGKPGFFRKVLGEGRIKGPILVTCTHNDSAVGKAYPIASQLAGQVGAGLGDKNSRWGGIGANGAQKTDEAGDGKLLEAGGAYEWTAGRIHNLNADAFIKNHSDICGKQVAHALLSAIATT
jgi:pimeloyl-ACP methyl ester carboxylesterase